MDTRPGAGSQPERPTPTGEARLVAVDVLRGIAALAVVFTHVPRAPNTGIDLRFLLGLPFDFGVLGVPMFIVISGFCIHLGYARRLASGRLTGWSWTGFWKRRFFRLYPTYVLSIAFSLAVVSALWTWTGQRPDVPANRTWDLVTHLLMVHNLTEEFSGGLGNAPFWTLGLEEQLYALFAVLVLLRASGSAARVLLISLAVSVAWRMFMVWTTFVWGPLTVDLGPVTLGYWTGWPFGWWFLWVLGAVAAEWHVGLVQIPRWITSWGLIVSAAGVTGLTHWRTLGRYTRYWMTDESVHGWLRPTLDSLVQLSELVFAVGCFALLVKLIRTEQAGGLTSTPVRFMAGIGLFSYSLYLIHVPTIEILNTAFGPPDSLSGTAVRLLAYVPACVAFAAVFFRVCERPFLRLNRLPASSRLPAG